MSSSVSNLVIRADAGLQMGTGHVMRCLALAEPWLKSGSRVTFVSSNLPRPITERIQNLGIKTVSLGATAGSRDDAIELGQFAAEPGPSWVVVDGYQFDANYQLALKEAGARILFFDDFGHAKNYSADFILNQNLGATAELYSHREPQTQLLLGTRFVQLRGEFDHWRDWRRNISPEAKNILVTLGGSDFDNVALKVVQALKLIPSCEASIVVGNTNPHRESLAIALQDSPNLHLIEGASNMPELIAKADLAVAAGGSTAWELAFMGLPGLILILAENQRANAEHLEAVGISENLGLASAATSEMIAEQIKKLSLDFDRRAAMSQNGRSLVDGFGSMRVWFRLNETAIRLRRATATDAHFIWELANDSTVREVSFSSDPIRWEDHLHWFQKKLSDPTCFLWIAEDDSNVPLGVVRFDLQNDYAVISVSLDKNRRGKNCGSLLIWLACRKLFAESNVKAIDAFIKPDNHASIRVFQKAGLEQVNETTIKNQHALRFQIKRGQHEP